MLVHDPKGYTHDHRITSQPLWNLSAMVVPERVMQTADGELSPASLLDYGACILKQQHARQHVPAVQELARPSWAIDHSCQPQLRVTGESPEQATVS